MRTWVSVGPQKRRQMGVRHTALTVEEGGDEPVDGMPHHCEIRALPPRTLQRLSAQHTEERRANVETG